MADRSKGRKVARSPAPRRGSARRPRWRWSAEGARVALGGRREDRLDELAERIEGDGGTALAIEADVTDEEQASALVAQANDELGGLDILVNNAGVMLLGPVAGRRHRAVAADDRRQPARAPLLHPRGAADDGRRRGSGDIVNVSSVAGRTAALGSGVYNMTKWGVVGFSEALRQEAPTRASGSPASSPASSRPSSRATTSTRWSSSGSRR